MKQTLKIVYNTGSFKQLLLNVHSHQTYYNKSYSSNTSTSFHFVDETSAETFDGVI